MEILSKKLSDSTRRFEKWNCLSKQFGDQALQVHHMKIVKHP